MTYSHEVEMMCPVAQGVHHGAAPIPEEAKWVKAKEIKDISGFTHGIGWCAPQQGTCKLTLNVKEGVIQEALVETIGCSGMTHSAAMASEILPGLTILEALNTDLVCDAINTAMRELFLQIVYGRSQSAFSEDGLVVGAGLEDLGKGLRSQVGTMYGTLAKGPRYLEMTDGYVTGIALDADDEIIGYKFINFGKMMDFIKAGDDANTAFEKASAAGKLNYAELTVPCAPDNDGFSYMRTCYDKLEKALGKPFTTDVNMDGVSAEDDTDTLFAALQKDAGGENACALQYQWRGLGENESLLYLYYYPNENGSARVKLTFLPKERAQIP